MQLNPNQVQLLERDLGVSPPSADRSAWSSEACETEA